MSDDLDRRSRAFPRIRGLWRGEVPLPRAFWWYAMVVGTLVNIAASFAFMASQVFGVHDTVAFAAFLLPVPYNLFVAVAVWRSADHYTGPPLHAHLARLAVAVWAIVASFT